MRKTLSSVSGKARGLLVVTEAMSVAAQVLDLAAGRDHSLVLRSGAQLVGWGGDGTGRFPAPLGVCSAPSSESGAVYVPTDVELRHITASASNRSGP